jgi:predicted ATPase/DNA-binding CsgD family transcriptional regulator
MTNSDSGNDLVEPLTERELEIVTRFAQGKTNHEIALELVLSPNTIKWYTRQIFDKLGVSDRQQAAQQALALGLLPSIGTGALPGHNLPVPLTPFVGREEELAQLAVLLGNAETRLLTLIGPGGIGKTRLALQAATRWLYQNPGCIPDGAYFQSLAAVEEPRLLAESLAELLGLAPGGDAFGAPVRLARFLRSRQMLLLLDNAEHLVGPDFSAWLDDLLREAPRISLLVTSRRALDVRGEQLFWVEGLQLPQRTAGAPHVEPLVLARGSSAVSLFLQTARRSDPDFELTDGNAETVIAICRAVAAMPLGIELAAAWIGVLSPAELLEELGRSPDILTTEAGNVPAGQRSIRAVFDTSWKYLTSSEREAVRSLSIFRGGFTRAAAEAVCELSLPTLLALVNKCWLQRSDGGRLSMHDLLRQYGVEALSRQPDQLARVRLQHSLYYCQWLQEQYGVLCGPAQRAAQRSIAQELSNIRIACRTAIAMGQIEPLAQAVHALGQFFRWTGRFVEGDKLFAALLQNLDERDEAPQSVQKLRVRLLVWRVSLRSFLGHDEESEGLARDAEAVLAGLERAGEPMFHERLYIAVERGYNHLLRKRRPEEALNDFSAAHVLARKIGSPWEEGPTLLALARALRNLQRLDEAERAVAGGRELLRIHGNETAYAEATALHGNILMRSGRFQEAEALLEAVAQSTIANPDVEAYLLVNLGWVRLLQGQFDRAEQAVARGIAKYHEIESAWAILFWSGLSCESKVHQGQYQAAVELAEKVFVPSGEPANLSQVKATKDFVRGEGALANRQWDAAREHLNHSLAARQPTADWHLTFPNACLALVARGSGEDEAARQYLASELEMTLTARYYPALILCLLVGALLWADRGNVERAAAIYARVRQEPYARNSVWLWDVAGRELDALLVRLPEAARQVAEKRYQGEEFLTMAAELAQDLPA